MPRKADPEHFMSPVQGYKEAMDHDFLAEADKSSPQDARDVKLGALVEKFCSTTSMHGCGQISAANQMVAKMLWCILTLGAVCGLMIHLYSIFYSYYQWPIQTKVSLGFDNLKYPAVTLCNVNKIRRSELFRSEDMKKLNDLVEVIDPGAVLKRAQTNESSLGLMNIAGMINITAANSSAGLTNSSSTGTFSNLYSDIDMTSYDDDVMSARVNETADDDWGTDVDPVFLLEEVFDTLFFDIDRKKRAQAGHDISVMLLSCMFNGYKCYPENFTLYQSSSLGNCWKLSSPKLVAKQTGSKAGLSLILYLQTDEFIPGMTNGYGVKVIIHDRGTKPLPQDEGIYIAAASETNIGLVQKSIIRLGEPYGKCNDGLAFKQKAGFSYSRQTCQVACKINEMLKSCGCYGNFYEEIALLLNKNARICNTTEDSLCLNLIKWNLQQKKTVCRCDNPCSEVVYEMSVSGRQWPTESFAGLLLEGVCEHDPSHCNTMRGRAKNAREVANNFVKLNIYYETLNYEMIEEEPLIDVFQFLASIGGALGLWIGLSLLSFCEIFQLIVSVLHYLLERCRKSGHLDSHAKS